MSIINELQSMLPCRKCGNADHAKIDINLLGTQQSMFCVECGEREEVQLVDLYESVTNRPPFDMVTLCYPEYAQLRALKHLIAEWNKRAERPAIAATSSHIDVVVWNDDGENRHILQEIYDDEGNSLLKNAEQIESPSGYVRYRVKR